MSGRIVLASTSTVRSRLLRSAGVSVSVVPPSANEAELKRRFAGEGRAGSGLAAALAAAKALSISPAAQGTLVIGADQVLLLDGKTLGKPSSLGAARRQLALLRGRTHLLVTAAAVACDGRIVWRKAATARLTMRSFSEAFLEAYLKAEKDHVTQSVGGYRLEAMGAQLFTKVSGDYFGILGLPLVPLLDFLRRQGALTE